MQVSKKLINDITVKLKNSVVNSDEARLQLAMDLYWAKNVINWGLTKYGGWTLFIQNELTIHVSTVYRCTNAAECAEKYGYTLAECTTILKAIGWSSFVFGLSDITRRLTVKGFIRKYKNVRYGSTKSADRGGDRVYTFNLPFELAEKLDFFLLNHGMTVHEHGRRGVREAMIRLVETKL